MKGKLFLLAGIPNEASVLNVLELLHIVLLTFALAASHAIKVIK